MLVRDFKFATDLPSVRRCMMALQEFSRAQDQRLSDAASVADEYLRGLFQRCESHKGKIFVAEHHGEVVGYVCVLSCVPTSEPADGVDEEAQIVDLFVTDAERGSGAGSSLLKVAEEFACSQGANWLRVQVFSWNGNARLLYGKRGFSELEVTLEKHLSRPSSDEAESSGERMYSDSHPVGAQHVKR